MLKVLTTQLILDKLKMVACSHRILVIRKQWKTLFNKTRMITNLECSRHNKILLKLKKIWVSMKRRKKNMITKIKILQIKPLYRMCREFMEGMLSEIQHLKKWLLLKKMKKKRTLSLNIYHRISWIILPAKILFNLNFTNHQ